MKNKPMFLWIYTGACLALVASFSLFAGPAYASSTSKTGIKHMNASHPKADKPISPTFLNSMPVVGNSPSVSKASVNEASPIQGAVEALPANDWLTGEVTPSTGTSPMFQIELTGTVEVIANGSWTIDGVVYLVDDYTKIAGMIQIGDQVEFRAYTTPSGFMALAKVELYSDYAQSGDDWEEEYEDQSSEDSGMYHSEEDDDQNQNGNSGSYQSSDEDHEDDPSGSYYEDDHEDDHGSSGWSGGGSGGYDNHEHDGDHEGHDD